MTAFHYTAINADGKESKGFIEADSQKQARHLLRHQGMLPLSLQTVQSETLQKTRFRIKHGYRMSSKELALVTRQLATLLAAGLPVEEALLAVSEQSERARLKALILGVREKVLEGYTLFAALENYPAAFSSLFCATIAAGEKSGYLDKVLSRLADYTEQQAKIRQKLQTALIYPTTVILIATSIVGFLLEYVVPKMIGVYGQLGQALPTLTTLLLGMSHLLQSAGLFILFFILVLGFSGYYAYRNSLGLREKVHHFILHLPFIAHAMKTADTARFARTLAILSSSGIPILEAMHIATQLIVMLPIRSALQEATQSIHDGAGIALSLKQTKYFSPMSIHMIASGEMSGHLEEMLTHIAAHQEEEITRLIDVSLALFEPAMILIMGAIVLFIVLAVLLPIFELNQFSG